MLKSLHNQKGMTLIEILIVLAIIGSVMGMLVVGLSSQSTQAKVDQTNIKIQQLMSALTQFKADAGFYPSSEQGLDALLNKPTSGKAPQRYRDGGYVEDEDAFKDAWGNDFSFAYPSTHGAKKPDIWSGGDDGEEGTGDDVNSWKSDDGGE